VFHVLTFSRKDVIDICRSAALSAAALRSAASCALRISVRIAKFVWSAASPARRRSAQRDRSAAKARVSACMRLVRSTCASSSAEATRTPW